jgi:ADP-ribose pyrophosphatase YjhB (NUDIX family)
MPVVMVVRDPGSVHVLPSGRRQVGESLEQTLRRELLEETGWAIGEPHLLGVRHFHQQGRTPATQPYPDFFQVVFVAQAGGSIPKRARSVAMNSLRRFSRSQTCDAWPCHPTSGCSMTSRCNGVDRPRMIGESPTGHRSAGRSTTRCRQISGQSRISE